MIDYQINDLVTVAKRDNNIKRPYLYVNPIQGKHIPVIPSKATDLFECMGTIIETKYPYEKILVIGFAETATAVGAGIACTASNVHWCMQTTREKYVDANCLYFTESHSHATEQRLISNGLAQVMETVDRVVFAEDEVTTGNTIAKLINSIRERFPKSNARYSIFSILNSMTDQRINELMEEGIECLYIGKIPYEYKIHTIDQYKYLESDDRIFEADIPNEKIITNCIDFRYVCKRQEYRLSVDNYVHGFIRKYNFSSFDSILVIGTEEFMYPPLMVAKELERLYPDKLIRFHATTRSPILVSDSMGYPLTNRNMLVSFYDEDRITYIYNLKKYDLVIILTDSKCVSESAIRSICCVLHNLNCKRIIIGKT